MDQYSTFLRAINVGGQAQFLHRTEDRDQVFWG